MCSFERNVYQSEQLIEQLSAVDIGQSEQLSAVGIGQSEQRIEQLSAVGIGPGALLPATMHPGAV